MRVIGFASEHKRQMLLLFSFVSQKFTQQSDFVLKRACTHSRSRAELCVVLLWPCARCEGRVGLLPRGFERQSIVVSRQVAVSSPSRRGVGPVSSDNSSRGLQPEPFI